MIDIPPEIWYHVARFVPDNELGHLLSVNSVFLELGMDLRWKDVTIDTRYTTTAMCILNRLSDRFVARRLKYLRLYLVYMKESTEGSRETAKDFKYFIKKKLEFIVNRVFKLRRDRREMDALVLGIDVPKLPQPRFSDVIDTVIDATPRLVNVTELTIEF